MGKMNMHSPNFTDKNIEKLAEIFPNCVTESRDENGKVEKTIDFDQLPDVRALSWIYILLIVPVVNMDRLLMSYKWNLLLKKSIMVPFTEVVRRRFCKGFCCMSSVSCPYFHRVLYDACGSSNQLAIR